MLPFSFLFLFSFGGAIYDFFFWGDAGVMEISLLRTLLNNISSFLCLSSVENFSSNLVQKYCQKAKEILKLLKPILCVFVDSEIASDEVLDNIFRELCESVDELRELFENWQPLSSKVYFVSSKIWIANLCCLYILRESRSCL